jgi:site-specific recombinase XerD
VLLRRKQLADITVEFDKLVSKDNLITIPANKMKESETQSLHFRKKYSFNDDKITVADISEEEERDLVELYKKNPNDEVFKKYVFMKGVHIAKKYELPIEESIHIFLELLKQDKYKVASIAKMPIFAKLDEIDPSIFKNNITITLNDVLDAYKNRIKKPTSSKSKKEAEDWINEFIEIIKFKTGKKPTLITDFTKNNVIAYRDEIYQVATIKDYKYKCKWLTDTQIKYLDFYKRYPKKKWYRDRVSKLHTLFNNYLEVNMLSDEPEALIVKTILDRLKNIQHFGKQKPHPKVVEVEDFQKLYKAGNIQWKCFFACAINFSFTFIDLCNLKKTELSLDKCFMEKDREKTDEYRCAYLHSLTVRLLRKYSQEDKQNNTDYFFINKDGNQLNPQTLRDLFVDLRKKAGIDESIKFKQLRKSALTVATEKGCNQAQIDLLSGHSLKGVDTHYIANAKDTVKNACLSVSQKYFKGLRE